MSALDKIQTTNKGIFLLIGIAVAAALYFSGNDELPRVEAEVNTARDEITKIEKDLEEAKKIAGDKAKFEEEVNYVSDQLRAALEYLPNKLDIQDILRKISNEARTAGVTLSKMKPNSPEAKGFYEELLMEVEIEGSYGQTTLFLSLVTKLPRIVNIRNVEISTDKMVDGMPMLKLKGILVAYRYLEGK